MSPIDFLRWEAPNPRPMPSVLDDLYQVGHLLDIWAQPCNVDPWIAVRAFWTYSPTLLWALLKPDPFDLAFERAGRPHRRVRKRRFRVVDKMQLPAPEKPGIGLAMFRFAQATEKLGWYLIIADATTDFLVNWTSMAFTWSGCAHPDTPYASCYGGAGQVGGAYPGTATMTVPTTDKTARSPCVAGSGFIGLYQVGPKTVGWNVNADLTSYLGSLGTIHEVKLIESRVGTPDRHFPGELTHQSGTNWRWSGERQIDFSADPWAYYTLQITYGPGVLTIHDANLTGSVAPPGGLQADP